MNWRRKNKIRSYEVQVAGKIPVTDSGGVFSHHTYFCRVLVFGMCDESFSINYTAEVPEGVDKGW